MFYREDILKSRASPYTKYVDKVPGLASTNYPAIGPTYENFHEIYVDEYRQTHAYPIS